MFLEVWSIMAASELKEAFGSIVTHLLTFFIILELFKSLVEYFREHRLKLTFIVDATLVFVLREVMIGLYQHQSSPCRFVLLRFWLLCLAVCAHSQSFIHPWNEEWSRVWAEVKNQTLRPRGMMRVPAVAPLKGQLSNRNYATDQGTFSRG